MITIRDYADKKKISYEAVRKQLKRYTQELKGHITVQNRTQYLDDFAVTFLDDKRKQSPVVIVEEARKEEYEAAKIQIEELKQTIIDLQNKLNVSKDKIMSLQEEKMTLIEERGKNQLLLEMKDRTDKELEDAKLKVLELEKENRSFQKTFFGLYKKTDL